MTRPFDRLAESKNSVANMELEIARLRAALKPFADADMDLVMDRDDRVVTKFGPTFGDFRRAHDVLYGVKITP